MSQEQTFRKSESFEINDIPFNTISIDDKRIVATGDQWRTFDILVSFVGGAWKEKWRRFGTKLLVVGIILLFFPVFSAFMPILLLLFGQSLQLIVMMMFMALGLVLVIVWVVVKKEALMLYTHGEAYKIEGTAGFVDDLWVAIRNAQDRRNL